MHFSSKVLVNLQFFTVYFISFISRFSPNLQILAAVFVAAVCAAPMETDELSFDRVVSVAANPSSGTVTVTSVNSRGETEIHEVDQVITGELLCLFWR